jgi:signal transduction histidine kinase
MLGRSLSLRAQLLIAFVAVLVGTTAVLTWDAYRSSLESLQAEASRAAAVAAHARAQALHRMLTNRQGRANGFLGGAKELCGEPTESGRYAWAIDCMQPMVDAFRAAEGALGATVTYRGQVVVKSGVDVVDAAPAQDALAHVTWVNGRPTYVMRAERQELAMLVQFGNGEVFSIFGDASNLGRRGEAFLSDRNGRFLTPARYRSGYSSRTPPGAAGIEPWQACAAGPGQVLDIDYRGVRTLHAYEPVPALEGACVDAHINHGELLQPAEDLRDRLLTRGGFFILIGALFSLIASHRIAAPVQRLARAARGLRTSLDEPIPVSGPSEVQALGRALREASTELAGLVGREQAARREAQSASSAKDRFLAAVSHELRTPLTAILGWTRIVRSQSSTDPRVDRGLEAIERNANAQRHLVEDLLDVSRIVTGQLRIVREPVELAHVVERALDAVRPQAHDKNVEVQTAFDNTGLTVAGDPVRLQQVVSNLAANAVKFTPAGGSVLVSLKRVADDVQLSVRDSGIGIDAESLPHVFDWFWQGDAPQDAAPAGLGLGLGIVRQLVEVHGGSVRAESDGHGHGARFVITLPLADLAPRREPAPRREYEVH